MSQDAPVAAATPGTPIRRRKLVPRAMLALTLVLGLWIGWTEAPREVGRWYLAAAVEHRVNADYFRIIGRPQQAAQHAQLANSYLEKALHWNADDGQAYLHRAKWRLADSESAGALADCQAAERLGISSWQVAHTKQSALVNLRRNREAVEEALKLHADARRTWSAADDVMALNGVAYFRALSREDLPLALSEINSALGQLPAGSNDAAMLDTRGFILYEMGRYEEAVSDFKFAVAKADQEVVRIRRPSALKSVVDYREFRIDQQSELRNWAVIYYHASLVLEKLNRWKEAKELRGKAKELLGREPDETVF
ncbi:MAG TPA: hypothetical protein VMP01_21690 [Pirellulaceae bacterium]|nr:hypothetical protein [Pirellulaceae bacterium]